MRIELDQIIIASIWITDKDERDFFLDELTDGNNRNALCVIEQITAHTGYDILRKIALGKEISKSDQEEYQGLKNLDNMTTTYFVENDSGS